MNALTLKYCLEFYGLAKIILGTAQIVGLFFGYFLLEWIVDYPSIGSASSINSEIFLLDYGKERLTYNFKTNSGCVHIQLLNMRFSKKVFLRNNIAILILLSLILKLIPFLPVFFPIP